MGYAISGRIINDANNYRHEYTYPLGAKYTDAKLKAGKANIKKRHEYNFGKSKKGHKFDFVVVENKYKWNE